MTVELSESFLSLLRIHDALNESFLLHQEALLVSNIILAIDRLRDFEKALVAHIRSEEGLLLPVYARAGQIPGGDERLFIGEHKKMLRFISGFFRRLEEMKCQPSDLKRQILRLFDEEAMFKMLAEHHDSREENILYPALDRVASREEKKELIARCILESEE